MSRSGHAVALGAVSLLYAAAAPVAFGFAVLAPTTADWSGGPLIAVAALVLLVLVIAAPLAAWAAFSMRAHRLAWISAATPLAWGVLTGVLVAFTLGR